MNKHQKTSVQATETLKYLQDKMDGLKQTLHGSLQHTMQDMLGVREQVAEQTRKFFPDTMISSEVLYPFKSSPCVTQRDGLGASALNGLA